ncbi:MAG: DUF4931 domain-containing protein [Elusimicrobiota bacterium]
MKPHLRKDLLSSNWVIISDERAFRPNDYRQKVQCPFCPGNENKTPLPILSLKKFGKWYIRVVPNKYPALIYDNKVILENEGLNKKYYLNGVHEVVIECREHNKKIYEIDHFEEVLSVFAQRMRIISAMKWIKYVMLFRNYGVNAGASLKHPHSQIIGIPLLPSKVEDEVNHFLNYKKKHNRCVMCDIIKDEMKYGRRLIYAGKNFVAFAPFASRFNFEVWIAPITHRSHFYLENNFQDLKTVLFAVFLKLHKSISDLSYNMILHSAPCNKKERIFHWHIEILPKLAMPAGFEWGSGFYINTISPEKVAEILNSGKVFKDH